MNATNQVGLLIERLNNLIGQGKNISKEFVNSIQQTTAKERFKGFSGKTLYDYEHWRSLSVGLIGKIIPNSHPLYLTTLELFNCNSNYLDTLDILNNRVARLEAIKDLLEDGTFNIQSEIGNRLVEIICLLKLVPAGLRRWTWEDKPRTIKGEARKWYIDNEYHVQNLLYLLLFPAFPDIKEEEHTPSVGQQNPRSDLAIPSLELIIEVKFMRANVTPQKIIEEIAADASLYLVEGSLYKQIIPFIWDDSRRNEEHELMRQGLKKINGIFDAVIISRPNKMNNQ